ncbi:MAG: hypothetical protein ACE5OZ_22820 [Candidatus Heimdallarchaeota archaeon]
MPDILFFLELAAKSVFLTSSFLLFIIQFQQIQKKAIDTRFFLLAMLMGSIAFTILLVDTVLWEIDPVDANRIFYLILVFLFLQLFAYFWYLHYESIISAVLPKSQILPPLSLIILNGVIVGLFVIGVNINAATLVPQITFLAWLPLGGLIVVIIVRNDLIELKRIPAIELGAVVIQMGAAAFLLVVSVVRSLGVLEKDASSFLTAVGLIAFFLGLLVLLLNYLLVNPPHVQLPSLQHELFAKMQLAFADQKEHIDSQIDDFVSTSATELIPKKLPSTAIFILIHILNATDFTSHAKSIETTLNLNKSTVSYNLALLEKEALIERKIERLDDDQRIKAAKISSPGLDFLFSFYLQLERHFKPSQQLGSHFMKGYAENLVDEALNVVLDGYAASRKKSPGEFLTEMPSEEGATIKPTKVLSPREIFFLPHHLHATALGVVTLQEGTVDEIANETGIDRDRTQNYLHTLREMGLIGVKLKAGRPTFFCSA